MAGHFPFSGNGGRASTTAFYERYGLNEELQEKYYKWWYDWAKDFVTKDSDLSATVGIRFNGYPMGQHSDHAFHLNGKVWPMKMEELGSFISNLIFPKLDEKAMHALEAAHSKALKGFGTEAASSPREAAPDVGLYRHI